MSQLVSRLIKHGCAVTVPCGEATPSAAWAQYVEDRVLPLTVPSASGSTELDVEITPDAIEQVQQRLVRVRGHLILDDVPLRAIVDLDLQTLRGFAQLQAEMSSGQRAVAGGQDSIDDSAWPQTQIK